MVSIIEQNQQSKQESLYELNFCADLKSVLLYFPTDRQWRNQDLGHFDHIPSACFSQY